MRIRQLLFIFCSLFCTTVPTGFAHPHVFIKTSLGFKFAGGRLEGLHVTWAFDEMFSAPVIMENDRNRNNRFDENEIKMVQQNAFSNLSNYNYFLFVDSGGDRMKIYTVNDFRAEIQGRKVVYRFVVPLTVAAGKAKRTVRVGCFDSTYFCDVTYDKADPVRVETDDRICASWKMVKDKKHAYWGGTIVPLVVHLTFMLTDGANE